MLFVVWRYDGARMYVLLGLCCSGLVACVCCPGMLCMMCMVLGVGCCWISGDWCVLVFEDSL